MSVQYTWEKVFQANHALVGEGTLSSRLASAAMYLGRLDATEAHFPWLTLRERYSNIMAALTREGSYETSAAALTEIERSATSRQILHLLLELTRLEEWRSPGTFGELNPLDFEE